MFNKKILFIFGLLLLISSCSVIPGNQKPAKKISDFRLIPPVITEIDNSVKYKDYIKAINEKGEINQVRMIEIFRRGQSKEAPPEYRLLEVDNKGVFYLLGLRERDVIIAADEFIIPNAPIFWEYIKLLEKTRNAKIEINRDGKSLLINTEIVD